MLEGIFYFRGIVRINKYFPGFIDKKLLVSPCLQVADQFRQ